VDREQIELVRESFAALDPQADLLVARFFAILFQEHADLRPLFPEDLTELMTRLPIAFRRTLRRMDRFHRIEAALLVLGKKCAQAGIKARHYGVFRETLLEVLRELSGAAWTLPVDAAWRQGLDAVSGIMLRGAFHVRRGRARRRAA
jgi:hemoglobin-like flavoprotein